MPDDEDALRALPGVGAYTAAAVAAFAFGRRTTVVDTNVRRVLARAVEGDAHAAPALTAAESALARLARAGGPGHVGHLERRRDGARRPGLPGPLAEVRGVPGGSTCAPGWRAGRPAHEGPPRRGQAWHGTDRQVRGAILQQLRDSPGPVARVALQAAGPDAGQVDRCLASLVEDGLLEPHGRGRLPPPAVTHGRSVGGKAVGRHPASRHTGRHDHR